MTTQPNFKINTTYSRDGEAYVATIRFSIALDSEQNDVKILSRFVDYSEELGQCELNANWGSSDGNGYKFVEVEAYCTSWESLDQAVKYQRAEAVCILTRIAEAYDRPPTATVEFFNI